MGKEKFPAIGKEDYPLHGKNVRVGVTPMVRCRHCKAPNDVRRTAWAKNAGGSGGFGDPINVTVDPAGGTRPVLNLIEQTTGALAFSYSPINLAPGDSFGFDGSLTGLPVRGPSASSFYSIQYSTSFGALFQVINIFADGVVGNAFNIGGVAAHVTGTHAFRFVINDDYTVAFYMDGIFLGNLAKGTQPQSGSDISFSAFGTATGTITRQWIGQPGTEPIQTQADTKDQNAETGCWNCGSLNWHRGKPPKLDDGQFLPADVNRRRTRGR